MSSLEAAQTPRALHEVLAAQAVKATTDAALLAGSRAVKVAAVGDVEVARDTRSAGASVCCAGSTERAYIAAGSRRSQSISAGGTDERTSSRLAYLQAGAAVR
jgi:hypothetical protein